MSTAEPDEHNVRSVVPFFGVTDMQRSLEFYVDGLRFTMKNKWTVHDHLRWCWLDLGGSALMLQEFWTDGRRGGKPADTLGAGVSLNFVCRDAVEIYHDLRSRGLDASEPVVGNGMWVTAVTDPDGYRLYFESVTDVPEETKLSELAH